MVRGECTGKAHENAYTEIRAKTIKNSVTQNKQRSVEELNLIITRLTAELTALKRYVTSLEKELKGGLDLSEIRKKVKKIFTILSENSKFFP